MRRYLFCPIFVFFLLLVPTFFVSALENQNDVSITVTVEPNQPPQPSFAITPIEGDTDTIFTFDASESSDKEDPSYRLRARWNFDNDGNFETDWQTLENKPFFQYFKIGKKEVKIEIIDTGQKISSLIKEIIVKAGPIDLKKSEVKVLLDLLAPNEEDSTKIVAALKDKYDNPIEGKKVEFLILEGDGSLEKTSMISSASGTAEIIYTAGTSINKTIVQAKVEKTIIGQVEINKKIALISFYTSPLAKIKIYDNDILIGESKTDNDGFFIFDCSGLKPGTHQIKILSIDKNENISTLSFSINTKNPTSFDYLLPPSLQIFEEKGIYKFSGFSAPFADIILNIESEIITKKTKANKDGFWEISVNKDEIPAGFHKVYVFAQDAQEKKSEKSKILEFELKKGIVAEATKAITETVGVVVETIGLVMEKVGEVIANQVQKIIEALPEPVQKAAKAVKQGTIIAAKAVGVAAKVTAEAAVITAKVANEIRENPVTQQVNKTIVTPIVGAGAAINTLPIISTIVLSDPLHLLLYFLSYISEAIGIRKKRHPWGIVYDSLTKEPLPFSTIRIFEEKTNKLCETHVTDRKGRFGFLIVPGKYYLLIQKTNYSFPSQKIKGISDESFTDLYHGEILEIKEEEGFIKVNIPLDQILVEGQKVKKNIFRLFLYFLEKIGTPLLMTGVILAGISLLINVRPLNICIFILYLALFFARKRLKIEKRISWGKVYDSENKKGIEIAQVQLFDKKWETLIEIQTTDRFGRFGFFVEKAGEYFIKVIKEEYQFPSQKIKGISDEKYNNLYYGETIRVEQGKEIELKMNIPIDKII